MCPTPNRERPWKVSSLSRGAAEDGAVLGPMAGGVMMLFWKVEFGDLLSSVVPFASQVSLLLRCQQSAGAPEANVVDVECSRSLRVYSGRCRYFCVRGRF